MTLCFYLVLNLWLSSRIDHTYRTFRAPEFELAATPDEAVDVCFDDLKWLATRDDAEGWLRRHFEAHGGETNHRQILAFIGNVQPSSNDEARANLLHRQVTGRRSWTWLMLVNAESTTGEEVFSAQTRFDGRRFSRALDESEQAAAKSKFVKELMNSLVDAVHPRIRDLRRINGPIQWTIVFLFALIAVCIGRRWLMLRALQVNWRDGADANIEYLENRLQDVVGRVKTDGHGRLPESRQTRMLQEELGGLREAAGNDAYGHLGFLVGLLPSLGFIGTVWGMGAALVQADRLMNATNQQLAIKDMTQELGYAFDTTFIGLVAAVILGVWIASLKAREWRFYDVVFRDLKSWYVDEPRPESPISEMPT